VEQKSEGPAARIVQRLERRLQSSPCCAVRCAKIKMQPQLFSLALVMAVGSLGLSAVSLAGIDELQLGYSVGISAVLCALAFLWLPTPLAKVNLYMFLQDVLYVQIYGAVDYFYTAGSACVPDGPHFDYTFYASWSGIVGSVAGWIGVILFQVLMGNWKFRHVFWVTTVIRVCASMVDVIIIQRWNTEIGVDDKVMYMLGDNIIYAVCYMMNFMPAVVLTSKVCPKNMEATIYALLAGFQNFGQNVAASIGIYMIKAFQIRTSEEDGAECNFKNLSIMVVVCHFALPLLAIPLTFVLIPNAKLTDEIEVKDDQHTDVWCGRVRKCPCCRSPSVPPSGETSLLGRQSGLSVTVPHRGPMRRGRQDRNVSYWSSSNRSGGRAVAGMLKPFRTM